MSIAVADSSRFHLSIRRRSRRSFHSFRTTGHQDTARPTLERSTLQLPHLINISPPASRWFANFRGKYTAALPEKISRQNRFRMPLTAEPPPVAVPRHPTTTTIQTHRGRLLPGQEQRQGTDPLQRRRRARNPPRRTS